MAVGDLIPPSYLLRRVNTTPITAASGTFTTTETALATVTGVLEAGQRYAIVADNVRFSASAVGSPSLEAAMVRIREDNLTGTEIGANQIGILTSSTIGFGIRVYTEFTAAATGAKTFQLTAVRQSGANNIQMRGSTGVPGFLTIDMIL